MTEGGERRMVKLNAFFFFFLTDGGEYKMTMERLEKNTRMTFVLLVSCSTGSFDNFCRFGCDHRIRESMKREIEEKGKGHQTDGTYVFRTPSHSAYFSSKTSQTYNCFQYHQARCLQIILEGFFFFFFFNVQLVNRSGEISFPLASSGGSIANNMRLP